MYLKVSSSTSLEDGDAVNPTFLLLEEQAQTYLQSLSDTHEIVLGP